MIKQILISEFKASIILAIPIIVITLIKPGIYSYKGSIILLSILMGCYITYLNYIQTKDIINALQFTPSDEYKEQFTKQIIECNLNPHDVNLKYAYNDDALAVIMFNTIAIDPFMFKNIDSDPEAIKVKTIVQNSILIGLPEIKKNLLLKFSDSLTILAQQFIFKHELGHLISHYSFKKIALIYLIATTSTFIGISTAYLLASSIPGALTILLGIITFTLIDLFLSYISNATFKYYEEKNADKFACKYSSKEEINAAADFFIKYEELANEYKKSMSLISHIPQRILSGHPNGIERAKYLREQILIK